MQIGVYPHPPRGRYNIGGKKGGHKGGHTGGHKGGHRGAKK